MAKNYVFAPRANTIQRNVTLMAYWTQNGRHNYVLWCSSKNFHPLSPSPKYRNLHYKCCYRLRKNTSTSEIECLKNASSNRNLGNTRENVKFWVKIAPEVECGCFAHIQCESKKVAPLKLFVIFSLLVNLCN